MMDCSDCCGGDSQAITFQRGAKENCESCRFWSELVARAIGAGPIEALCLAGDSPNHENYVRGNDHCQAWKLNNHGAVDDPHCGSKAVLLYAEEE
jgi:hypothetical protein